MTFLYNVSQLLSICSSALYHYYNLKKELLGNVFRHFYITSSQQNDNLCDRFSFWKKYETNMSEEEFVSRPVFHISQSMGLFFISLKLFIIILDLVYRCSILVFLTQLGTKVNGRCIIIPRTTVRSIERQADYIRMYVKENVIY